MTNDQEFILALVALVLPGVASVLTYRQSRQTRHAVNGLVAKSNRRARAQGRVQGRADTDMRGLPLQKPVVLPTDKGPVAERVSRGP